MKQKRARLSFNTWINGVYCTGKTAEEVNSELLSQIEAPIVRVTDKEGNVWEIALPQTELPDSL